MENKTWTVVSFDNKTVEAIPTHWIQGDFCHWPPYVTDKLLNSIKRGDPLNTCWPTHHVTIFRNATYDNYGKARQKSKLAEETSDLNTDTESVTRKRTKKILSSSSDSDRETVLPSPPKLKKKKRDNPKSTQRQTQETIDMTPKPRQNQWENNTYGEASTTESNNTVLVGEKDKYLKGILEQVHINRAILTDILSEIKEIKKTVQTGHFQNPEQISFSKKFANVVFPIMSQEQFDTLEAILENEEDLQLLVTDFAKIGGSSLYNFVKRVLSTSLSNDIAIMYSWLGRKGKKPFFNLHTANAIIYAAEMSGLTKSRKETEVAIQMWLKRATDRRVSSLNKKLI